MKKTAKTSRQKTKGSKKRLLLIFIAGFLVLLAGFYVKQRFEARSEFYSFTTSKAQVNSLKERIVSSFGQPERIRESNSCRYASRKFKKGPLSCTVSVSLEYSADNNEEAEAMAIGVDRFVSAQTDLLTRVSALSFVSQSESFGPPPQQINHASSSFRFKQEGLFGPSIDFIHEHKDNFSGSDILTIQISSSKQAKAEHYPLRD